MSQITHYGHGIWCDICQCVYENSDECEHGFENKNGIQKTRDGYAAQPNDMGHYSPHIYHDIDGFETCIECGRTKIPEEMIEG